MDYERIHKVQTRVMSPSKLSMKLLGVHHNSKMKEAGRRDSSATSPSELEELEYLQKLQQNNLLASVLDEQASSVHCSIELKPAANTVDPKSQIAAAELPSRSQNITRAVSRHPARTVEEDGAGSGCDSGSTFSFELCKGERWAHHPPAAGPFSRHVPSKWNDAEKWIASRQAMRPHDSKKNVQHSSQGSRPMSSNWTRNVPEMIDDTYKRIDLNNPNKFSFVPRCLQPKLGSGSASKMSESADFSRVIGDSSSQGTVEKDEDQKAASAPERFISAAKATKTVESVSMRDVGTEMTPIDSQDPSRTGTPMVATTPSRSPRSSAPPTPKRGAMAKVHDELSEKESKLKTRREIADLGVQLGKMSIASWARNEAAYSAAPSPGEFDAERNAKEENEARAAAWEEAEKAKHMARYKQEEIKIQAWENRQKAKIEAKMRKLEVVAERMRARGHEKIAQKAAETRQKVEERRADAEAGKNQKAARTARRVEQIRRTGRVPPSHVRCCSWLL